MRPVFTKHGDVVNQETREQQGIFTLTATDSTRGTGEPRELRLRAANSAEAACWIQQIESIVRSNAGMVNMTSHVCVHGPRRDGVLARVRAVPSEFPPPVIAMCFHV